MAEATEHIYWQKDAEGRVLINAGGRLLARPRLSDDGRLARGSCGLTMPHGAKFRVGYVQGETFVPVTPLTVAAAKVGTISYLDALIRLRADVATVAAGIEQDRAMTALPDTDPTKVSMSHAGAVAWLPDGAKARPAVEVDGDTLFLCDELIAVAKPPKTMCQLKFWMRLDADIQEPAEPERLLEL